MKTKGIQCDGVILKGYSGFYYVWDGFREWECSLRGKFRIKKQTFLPGDGVTISIIDESKEKAVIEKVHPRHTELVRPPVANVEQVVIIMALVNPEPDFWLLDRLLLMSGFNKVKPVICFNKNDLITEEEREIIISPYRNTGFPLVFTSGKKGWGLDELRSHLQGTISVFAGPSGVGKSSLLNVLEPGLSLKTGEVSEKLARGRHTTRHVELMKLSNGGFLADTPGFSSIYLPKELKREQLTEFYPDFLKLQDRCRFNTCLHRDEPQCAVREAVANKVLDAGRYQRYLNVLDEVIAQERRF